MIDYPIISKILMRDNVPWFLTEVLMKELDELWDERNRLRDDLKRELFWHELRKSEEGKLEEKLQVAQNELAELQDRESKRQAAMKRLADDYDKIMIAFLKDYGDADA